MVQVSHLQLCSTLSLFSGWDLEVIESHHSVCGRPLFPAPFIQESVVFLLYVIVSFVRVD